jgi:hypothetical protein
MCSRSVFCSDPAVLYSQVCPYLSVIAGRLLHNGVPSAPTSAHLNQFLSPRSTSRSATLAGDLS